MTLMSIRVILRTKAIHLAWVWTVVPVWAQTLPDAGSIRQQIEQAPRELRVPQALPPQHLAPKAATQQEPGLRFRVESFKLVGNTLLATDLLSDALAQYTHRELDFSDLQRAADAITATYREAGWMAQAEFPEQDISDGVITLLITEARFGGIRFEGEAAQQVMPSEIEAYFLARQRTHQPLRVQDIDRALLLVNDLPGLSVAATLTAGQNDGETALVLQTADQPFIYGDVGADNQGARSTGSERVLANLNINSLGRRGELISMNLLHTQGSDYGRVALTVPDGYNGLRLGVNASSMTYKVIEGTGAAAQLRGHSGGMGVDFNYPLQRTREQNLYLQGALETKTFFTQDSTQISADYASDSLRLGLSGNQFDGHLGGGANSATVQLLWGRLTDMTAHTLISSIDRSYNKLSYSLSRQQTLTADQSLYLALQGQHALQVLDSSEKFYIGGAQSVRAYPTSELGGERGQQLSAEWRWRLGSAFTLTPFVDWGRVVSLPTNSSQTQKTLVIQGHGLSLSWQGPKGLSAKATWARRNGSNPQPTSTGTDGDGTLKENRFWFTASLPFSF